MNWVEAIFFAVGVTATVFGVAFAMLYGAVWFRDYGPRIRIEWTRK